MHLSPIYLPSIPDIEKMFAKLTGPDTKVESSTTWPFADFKDSYVASYRDDFNNLCAFTLIDLAAGASTASALTKIPAARTKEVISAGHLDEILLENLAEVLNISASLLNKDNHLHVVFNKVTPFQSAPSDFNALLATSHQRIDVKIQVPNYLNGRLSFFSKK